MNNTLLLDQIPEVPFTDWFNTGVNWLTDNLAGFFDAIVLVLETIMNFVTNIFLIIPPEIFIIVLVVVAFFAAKKSFGLPAFVLVGMIYIYNQGLWESMLNTLTLVLFASAIAIIIGVPLGIWSAKSDGADSIISPILDFLQTMPSFVYLIPAVAFFGIGMVPGVFAAVIYAIAPTVRQTNLGIRSIDTELIEAAESFGSTGSQKLRKVEMPLAMPNIMAGINQTVMLTLSMVVIASMIGAPGLGDQVVLALQRADFGPGFVAGIAIVILAITLDRLIQTFGRSERDSA